MRRKIGGEQADFTAGRSCLDHIHTIQLVEKMKAKDRDVHLAFIDLRKIYDTVPRKKLWEAMSRFEIPGKLIRSVKTTYQNNMAHITRNPMKCSFKISKGLLKGPLKSPTLFKIFLGDILRPWKRKNQEMRY